MSHRRLFIVFILIMAIPFGLSAANKGKKSSKPKATDQVSQTETKQTKVIRSTTVQDKAEKDIKAGDVKPIVIEPKDEITFPTPTASPEAGEQINWQVISSGATDATSASYHMLGTLGQTAVGSASSASYSLLHGYWQVFGPTSETCCGKYTAGLVGNVDYDTGGKFNLTDITLLIDRVYVSKNLLECEENGDIAEPLDTKINLADITRLIDRVYVSKTVTAPCI